jgi:hypothetical protein
MNPSPAAIAAIRAHVADWSASDAQVAASLNAEQVANPAPQGTVPTPFYQSDVLGLLSEGSKAKLKDVAFLPRISDDIKKQDRPAVGLWAQVLALGSVITADELTALAALLAATGPDPSYPPQVSWAMAYLGRPVDAADVSASRPS